MSLQKDLNHKTVEPKGLPDGSLFMFNRQSTAGAQP